MRTMLIGMLMFLGVVSTSSAQAPARGFFAGLGMHSADVEELNTRLAAAGFPTFSDEFLSFTLGHNWWGRRIVGSIDVGGLFQPAETNTAFRTHLSGAYGLVSFGVRVPAGRSVLIYPMASVGGGSAQLRIQSRSDINFDQLLQNPGRNSEVANASLLFGPRLGAHYYWRRGERNGSEHGLVLGMRAGYLFSAFEGEWAELENESVDGGPSLTLEGLQLTFTVGGYGERRPRLPR